MPLWVRKFIVDAVETGIGAILALTLVIPGSVTEAKAQLLVVGLALLVAMVAAVRRAVPGFLVWLNEKLGTTG